MTRRPSTTVVAALAMAGAGLFAPAAAATAPPPPAASGTAAVAARLAPALRAAGSGDNATVASCPAGDVSALIAKAPAALGLDPNGTKSQKAIADQGSTSIFCTSAGPTIGAVVMGQPFTTDVESAIRASIASVSTSASVSPAQPVGAGAMVTYCVREAVPTDSFCAAVWMDRDVLYGVVATGPSANGRLVGEWMLAVRDDLTAAILANGGGSSTPAGGDLDTTAAAAVMRATLQAEGRSNPDLTTCPLGAVADYLPKAPAGLDVAGVIEQPRQSTTSTGSEVATVICTAEGGGKTVSIYVGEPFPNGLKAGLESILPSTTTASFSPEQPVRGGTLVTYCATDSKSTTQSYCEADWANDEIDFAIAVAPSGVTGQQVGDWLLAVLDDLVAATAASGSGTATPGTAVAESVLDTAQAAAGAQAAVAAAATEANQRNGGSLSSCPLLDVRQVVAAAPASFDRSALGTEVSAAYLHPGDLEGPLCLLRNPSGASIAWMVSKPFPGGGHAEAEALSKGLKLSFEPDRDHRGGTIVTYCAANPDGSQQFCDAAWSNAELNVELQVLSKTVTPAEVTAWLVAMLEPSVRQIATAGG